MSIDKNNGSLALKKYPDLSDEQFLKTLVHESNNFLSPISGFTELALMDIEVNSPIQSYLDEILFAVKRNVEFNQQLLMLSGHHKPSIEQVGDLDIELMLEQMNFNIRYLNKAEFTIESSKKWMLRVFSALMSFANSLKQGSIPLTIKIFEETVDLQFSFEAGAFKIDESRLFQPFYSSRNLSAEKGLGICWIPAFMSNIKGNLETNMAEDGKIIISLCFRKS